MWSFTGVDLSGSLTGAAGEGLLFCSNGDGEIFGIDPDTGEVERLFSTTLGQLQGGMAYLNGELIVGAVTATGAVYRVDPVSGESRGTLDLGGSQFGVLAGLGGDGAVGTGTSGRHFVNVRRRASSERMSISETRRSAIPGSSRDQRMPT